MESKVVFLLITIIILWVLFNPKSRAWIKSATSSMGSGSNG